MLFYLMLDGFSQPEIGFCAGFQAGENVLVSAGKVVGCGVAGVSLKTGEYFADIVRVWASVSTVHPTIVIAGIGDPGGLVGLQIADLTDTVQPALVPGTSVGGVQKLEFSAFFAQIKTQSIHRNTS